MAVANTLAYNGMATMTAVLSFIVQALGVANAFHFQPGLIFSCKARSLPLDGS
jgi:hypothetical protein